MSTNFYERVSKIQKELKAPKSQRNNFGNYNYRNCEDILEAVKPLLGGLVLTVSDDVVAVGNRIYIKSTSTITDGTTSLSNTAFARESEEKKGMDSAQISGSSSSYARKYSLNGLFLIDDTKDADSDAVTAVTRGEKMPEKTSPAPKAVTAKVATPEEKVVAANPENAVTATPAAPVKKSGPWGAKKSAPATTSGGDLY